MKEEIKEWAPYGEDTKDVDYSLEIEVRNGNGYLLGVVGDFVEGNLSFSAEASDLESSDFSLPGTSPWAKTFMRANMRVILVHITLYRSGVPITRPWTGRVDRAVRRFENGQGKVDVELISDKKVLKDLLAWSAPGSALWIQAPKEAIYTGPVIHTLKRIASDNLLRITGNQPIIGTSSVWMDRSEEWSSIDDKMPSIVVMPTRKSEDTSPELITQVAMTPMDEVWSQACKDYNLLPTARMYIPGRDTPPERLALDKPTIILDIVDKDLTRARSEVRPRWEAAFSLLGPFIRGLFGQFDVPPTLDVKNVESLKDFFGRRSSDPWVIFRDSAAHMSSKEVASFSPTVYSSISGGKSQEFLNKGLSLGFNTLINGALASLGLGFVGIDVGGFFDDVLFAYQRAEDKSMKEFLGEFTGIEEFAGDGLTAYSFDAAQNLRQARRKAVGYQTATFSGDIASFAPFRPFEDFDLLDPVGWEDEVENTIFTERVKEISVSFSREKKIGFEVKLGEIDRPEEPEAIRQREHESVLRALNTLARRD